MNTGKTVFAQVMDYVHRETFQRIARRYHGEDSFPALSCREHFLAMAFAQMASMESLRDTVDCLEARADVLYHMGFRGPVRRSTLADANERRDWRLFAALGQYLIRRARKKYAGDPLGFDLDADVYAFDSTTIDLCLSLFRWAKFRRTKAAIKLHVLLDLRGPIPSFVNISDGKLHDVNALDDLLIDAGAFYVMDRGYLDFTRLYALHSQRAFFVIRAKRGMSYTRRSSASVPPGGAVISDQIIYLRGRESREAYPERLRRVRYYDADTKRFFVYLTNNFEIAASTVAALYKSRWQVELFFKWIKQHLRIKRFFGTSAHAVKTQVWIAICVYSIVAILKKDLALEGSLHKILQIFGVNLFSKVPIQQLLTNTLSRKADTIISNQLLFNDL